MKWDSWNLSQIFWVHYGWELNWIYVDICLEREALTICWRTVCLCTSGYFLILVLNREVNLNSNESISMIFSFQCWFHAFQCFVWAFIFCFATQFNRPNPIHITTNQTINWMILLRKFYKLRMSNVIRSMFDVWNH